MRLTALGAVVLALVGWAEPAHAKWNLAVGVKWLPASYTTPISPGLDASGNKLAPLSGFNTTNLNNYIGGFILDGRLGFTLGLDFGYSQHTIPQTMTMSTDESFVQFGLSLGSKYYLLKPRAGRVAPYVIFDFFKYFATVSSSVTTTPVKNSTDFLAGLASPLGIDAAVGCEYFFTNAFSVGGELLGLKYSYASGSQPIGGGFMSSSITTSTQYVTFYAGFTLNYRWEIGRTWKVREPGDAEEPADEERASHPRKTTLEPDHAPPAEKQPPPREPPPSETENVD